MSKEKLGDRIRGERKRKGYTQEDFAKKIGVTKFTISRVENGKGGVSIDTYIKCCDVLEIPFLE